MPWEVSLLENSPCKGRKMKERWTEVEADAKAKQEQQFAVWLSGENVRFEDSRAEKAYEGRISLLKDAIELIKPPSRVPVLR